MHTRLMEAYAVGAIQGTLQVTKMKCGSLQSELAELTRKGLCKWNYGMFEAALTYLLGEITEKPRLTMEWLPNNYAKLMVTHGVQINMMNYPGGQIIEPKHAVIHHLHEVISGWKNGQIKWVRLSRAEVKKQKEMLDLDAPTSE